MMEHHGGSRVSARVPWVAAYELLGYPVVDTRARFVVAVCTLCGSGGESVETVSPASVVSPAFTGWRPRSLGVKDLWCRGCVWVHTVPELRTEMVSVSSVGVKFPASVEFLSDLLVKPLRMDASVSLPVRKVKHVAASMEWGSVASDGGVFPWGRYEAVAFGVFLLAASRGANSAHLMREVPTPGLCSRLGYADAVAAWGRAGVLRGSPLGLVVARLAVNATR
jgi:hypothetical protein